MSSRSSSSHSAYSSHSSSSHSVSSCPLYLLHSSEKPLPTLTGPHSIIDPWMLSFPSMTILCLEGSSQEIRANLVDLVTDSCVQIAVPNLALPAIIGFFLIKAKKGNTLNSFKKNFKCIVNYPARWKVLRRRRLPL